MLAPDDLIAFVWLQQVCWNTCGPEFLKAPLCPRPLLPRLPAAPALLTQICCLPQWLVWYRQCDFQEAVFSFVINEQST